MTALTPSTAKTMCGKTVHCCAAVMAGVRSAEGRSKSEANCNPNGVVIHSEAKGRNREGIEPSSGLACRGSQKTGSCCGIRCAFQQGVRIDSPLSITNIAEMAMFYIKLTSLNDFPLEEGPISPTGQIKQSLDSLYDTDSPLSVTNIAEMPMFYKKNLTSLNDFLVKEG